MKRIFKSFIVIIVIIVFSMMLLTSSSQFNLASAETKSSADKLTVTFFEVGDGDCIFIDYGNIEIIIDSGDKGSEGKFSNIKNVFKNKIEDGILEYAFITHGDSDHLKHMVNYYMDWFNPGSTTTLSSFEKKYYINNLIDFDSAITKSLYVNENGSYKTSVVEEYIKKRNNMLDTSTDKSKVNKGIKNYYPIDAFYSVIEEDKIVFDDKLVLHVLRNVYNYEKIPNNKNLSSICLLLEYGESKVLLTGDLEKEGEAALLENNDKDLLSNVTLFKAGHHGSHTANTKTFIDHIKPEYVMISCNAGGKSYGFPHQNDGLTKNSPIDNFLTYTDYIFITSYAFSEDVYASYYGDVDFDLFEDGTVNVSCTNKGNSLNLYVEDSEGNKIFNPITETKWFKENRRSLLKTYVFSGYENQNNAFLGNCTLLKSGHYDILIDCGNYGTQGVGGFASANYIDDVKQYVIDGIIECVIVTNPCNYSISQLVDVKKNNNTTRKGILSEFEIETLIDFGSSYDPSSGASTSLFKSYKDKRTELIGTGTEYYSAVNFKNINADYDYKVCENLVIDILENPYYENKANNKFDSSLTCIVEFYGNKLLFVGNMTQEGEEAIATNNNLDNISFYLANDFGDSSDNTKMLLSKITNNDLTIVVNTIIDEEIFGKNILNKSLCDNFINCSKGTYVTTQEYSDGKYLEINGDVVYVLLSNVENYIENSNAVKLEKTSYYSSL